MNVRITPIWPVEIFAPMLLAFANFVGQGGDDIPNTIFSICFRLVLAAEGPITAIAIILILMPALKLLRRKKAVATALSPR